MVVSDFHIFVRDVLQHVDTIQKDYPEVPIFLLGHSMVSRPQEEFKASLVPRRPPTSWSPAPCLGRTSLSFMHPVCGVPTVELNWVLKLRPGGGCEWQNLRNRPESSCESLSFPLRSLEPTKILRCESRAILDYKMILHLKRNFKKEGMEGEREEEREERRGIGEWESREKEKGGGREGKREGK